jgi:hypothetical protein
MILQPFAVGRMAHSIRPRQKVAFSAFPLWDVHLRRAIMGVKIYDHEIMRNYPYQDVQSCEVDQMERLKADGFFIRTEWGAPWETHHGDLHERHPGIMGNHGVRYNARSAYERYMDLTLKYRRVGQAEWVAPWPRRFIERYRAEGDEADLWSFLGCMIGLIADPEVDRGERTSGSTPTWWSSRG